MSDPIDQALASLTTDGQGAPGTTRHIDVGTNLTTATAAWISAAHPNAAHVVVCDVHTAAAAGNALVAALRHAGCAAEAWVLEPHHGEPDVVCDSENVERARTRLPSVNAIAVGAGTINDIVKMATAELGQPYQCLATAASMNGYTSAIAAVLAEGVKRTWNAQQAEAVFADLAVIAKAPAVLNQAGFGDLLSKPYSNADWLLSHYVRGVAYAERPAKLLDDAYVRLLDHADEVRHADEAGIGVLTRTILLSGFTMAIAGTSAPASGGEHLISHYWDMEQHSRDLPLLGLHGTQVGIATRISALLFERLVRLDASAFDPRAASGRRPAFSTFEPLAAAHPRLGPDVVEEVRDQFAAKQRTGVALAEEFASIAERWDEIRTALVGALIPSERITTALRDAGAPARPSAIGCDRARAIATVRVCRQIRGRYVALDLLDDLGVLADWAEAAVDACERA